MTGVPSLPRGSAASIAPATRFAPADPVLLPARPAAEPSDHAKAFLPALTSASIRAIAARRTYDAALSAPTSSTTAQPLTAFARPAGGTPPQRTSGTLPASDPDTRPEHPACNPQPPAPRTDRVSRRARQWLHSRNLAVSTSPEFESASSCPRHSVPPVRAALLAQSQARNHPALRFRRTFSGSREC